MRKLITLISLIALSSAAFAQKADFRRGNREFKKGEYARADVSYRKGLLKDTSSVAGHYNLGSNLYRQENYEEAAKTLDAVQLTAGEEKFAADYYYNRGDVAIAAQDWQTAVNMLKECLRRTPADMDAKENYNYALNKLREQQQQQQQQQDQDKNQDQDQNQDQQDQQQDQNQDNKDQNQDQQQQQQQQQPQLSPQQAQQMLQAIQEKEKKTQEKVDEKKAQSLGSRKKEKNW